MKNLVLSSAVLFSVLCLASCGSGSQKGKWVDADKTKFTSTCTGVKEMKDLGQVGTDICGCMLDKSEKEFDSFSQADSDEKKMTEIATNCATEVMAKGLSETEEVVADEASADSTAATTDAATTEAPKE